MSKNTMTDLVTELKKLTPVTCIKDLIENAEKGEFHDYRSSQVCGKTYAVNFIAYVIDAGIGISEQDIVSLKKIRADIIDGEYDEPFTKEDELHVHAEVDADPTISDRDKAFFKSAMRAK